MKKIMRLAIGVLMAMNVFTATAFAAVPSLDYTSINQESKLCDKSVSYSQGARKILCEEVFISADVIIKDKGNGDIGASAYAYLAKPVTEMYVSLYLDRYDEDLEKWQRVDSVDFEYTLEEYPDGIEDPIINVTFKNQKKGYYYRIRGAFTASDGVKVEGFGPTTDGIWIE